MSAKPWLRLSPMTRTSGPIFLDQLEGAVVGMSLPFFQSLLLAWPQTVGLIAATILLFVAGYVTCQRK
jgi:ABC-2 type transport system permease protein